MEGPPLPTLPSNLVQIPGRLEGTFAQLGLSAPLGDL